MPAHYNADSGVIHTTRRVRHQNPLAKTTHRVSQTLNFLHNTPRGYRAADLHIVSFPLILR